MNGQALRRSAVLLLLVTPVACHVPGANDPDERERELAVMRLEVQMEALRAENRRLEERISTLERGGSARAASFLGADAAAVRTSPPLAARCTPAKTGFVLSGTALDEAFAQDGSMATEARIVPHFQEGHPTGFKLYSIKPDSLFASCGVKNGDVINTVNGMAIHSPDSALKAYSTLRAATRVELALTRAGKPETVRIEIAR